MIIGYIYCDRKILFYASCMMYISILLNFILKHTFCIPLTETLIHDGFAFPSGHTQSCMAFYGWIYLSIKKEAHIMSTLGLILILFFISIGMIYFGYHDLPDIIAAIITGWILISFFNILLHTYGDNVFIAISLLTAAFLTIYSELFYGIKERFGTLYYEERVWIPYYAILGMTLSYICFSLETIQHHHQKIISCITCLILAALVHTIELPTTLIRYNWAIISAYIPLSIHLSGALLNHITPYIRLKRNIS